MIHFVHPGFSKESALYYTRVGRMRPVGRGIYQDVDPDHPNGPYPDLHPHALAILAYRYPGVQLIGESARRVRVGLSPALPDGRVFAYYDRVQSRRMRLLAEGLTGIFHPFPSDQEPVTAHMMEIMTDFHVPIRVPNTVQILRDAIRIPEAAPSPHDTVALLQSLSPPEYSLLEAMEPLLSSVVAGWKLRATGPAPETPLAAVEAFPLQLQDRIVGHIVYDGLIWRLQESRTGLPAGLIPEHAARPFLESLLPEHEDLPNRDAVRAFFSEPRRAMSFTMGDIPPVFHTIPKGGDLARHTRDGLFTGTLADNLFQMGDLVDKLRADSLMPRISGMQPKAPGFLDAKGYLRVTDGYSPFTLLIKPDPQDIVPKLAGVPVLEWAGQQACKAAGVETPDHALVVAPDGLSSALLSERFDIPKNGRKDRYAYALDGMACIGLPADQKYQVTLRQLWAACLKMGVDPKRDAERFFDRTVAAWAMGDMDFHGKNLSILRECTQQKDGEFPARWQTRIAPGYDTVPVEGLPNLAHTSLSLAVEGQRTKLTMKTWKKWGDFLGLTDTEDRVRRIVGGIAHSLTQTAETGVAGLKGHYAKRVQDLLERAAKASRKKATTVGADDLDVTEVLEQAMR